MRVELRCNPGFEDEEAQRNFFLFKVLLTNDSELDFGVDSGVYSVGGCAYVSSRVESAGILQEEAGTAPLLLP